jgi:hypothetical protein
MTILQFVTAVAAVPAIGGAAKWIALAAAKKTTELLRLKSTICRSLIWSEVPEGYLHQCEHQPIWAPRICEQRPPADSSEACWESVIGKSLNVGWKERGTVKKPASLSRDVKYLRTDMKTIMAFVIRNNGGDCSRMMNGAFPDWEAAIRSGNFEINLSRGLAIKFERVDHVLTAHISGGSPGCPERGPGPLTTSPRSTSTALTKSEMDTILNGYPPFYREDMRSATDGLPLENPLRSLKDKSRGGWVVATELANLEPVGFYVEDTGHLANRHDQPMWKAMRRVQNILAEDIGPHFPEDTELEAAIKVIKRMIDSGTGSDANRFMTSAVGKRKESKADISNRVIRLFNRYGRLDESEVEFVRAHFIVVLQSAVWGVFRVVSYFKDTAVWVPRIVMTQEMVYLRSCGEQHR